MGKLGVGYAIHRLHQIYIFARYNSTTIHTIFSIQIQQTKRTKDKRKIYLIYWYTYITRSQFNRFHHNLELFSKI